MTEQHKKAMGVFVSLMLMTTSVLVMLKVMGVLRRIGL
jgi:hypothetical protein